MNEILKNFELKKERYREIFIEELKVFGDDFEDRIEQLRTKIFAERKKHECKKCGSCCKLAATPCSYDELKEMAKNDDKFAKQFVETFTPFEDENEIRNCYPDYYDCLKESGEALHFYHCLKVDENNMCSDYENRPQICRDFPDNPVDVLPLRCEFKRWQNNIVDDVLRLRAIIEIRNLEKENE